MRIDAFNQINQIYKATETTQGEIWHQWQKCVKMNVLALI